MSCNNSFYKITVRGGGGVRKVSRQTSIGIKEGTSGRQWTIGHRVVPLTRLANTARLHFFERGCILLGRGGRGVYNFGYFHFFPFPVVFSSICSGAGNPQSFTVWSKDLHREHWPGLRRSAEASRKVAYQVVSR